MIRILLLPSKNAILTEGKIVPACAKCEYTSPWWRINAPVASPLTSFYKRKSRLGSYADSSCVDFVFVGSSRKENKQFSTVRLW